MKLGVGQTPGPTGPAQTQGSSTPAPPLGTPGQFPPTPTGQTWGQQEAQNVTQQTANLQDIEQMVRDHIANNQQYLHSQTPGQGSYAGPTMAHIRQDPGVQAQADLVMNSIKTSCPVFGQHAPAGPATAVPGINPLYQDLQGSHQVSKVNLVSIRYHLDTRNAPK
jgi:hypothetical protein